VGGGPRKGAAFPQVRRQSRFGVLPFEDFDATLRAECHRFRGSSLAAHPSGRGVYWLLPGKAQWKARLNPFIG